MNHASGGAGGVERLRERIDESHVDLAALVWMLCIAGYLGTQVYGALRASQFGAPFGGSDWWFKAALLAASGNIVLTFGCTIGIALAALYDSTRSRAALVLAALGGLWAVAASVLGIVVSFHENSGVSFISLGNLTDSKVASAIAELMLGGLGAVVLFVAWSVLSARRTPPAVRAPEIADLT